MAKSKPKRKRDSSRPRPTAAPERKSVDAPARASGWRFAPFRCSLLGGLLFLLAFPPFGWWPLAFLAPAPWVWLVRQPKLNGPRPYLWMWLGAAIGWLAILQGIRLPHWILYIGWFALSLYVSSYVPLFVAISRIAVVKWKWPLIVVAPIVWVALEYWRGFFATGFSVGLVSHPLTEWTTIIQVADLGGAYALSLVVMIVAASLARGIPTRTASACAWPLIPLVLALGIAWLYGSYRLKRLPPQDIDRGVKVCLLQANQDVVFQIDEQRGIDLFVQCLEQAVIAKREHPDLQLIVWPESTFTANKRDVQVDGVPRAPVEIKITRDRLHKALQWATEDFENHRRRTAKAVLDAPHTQSFDPPEKDESAGPPALEDSAKDSAKTDANAEANPPAETWQLVGAVTERFGDHEPERLNTALLMDHRGETKGRYFKTHRVMFGEYVPLGDQIPYIYSWTPMQRGLTAGDTPMSFQMDQVRFTPFICFETTVPHLVRGQFNELAEQDAAPDVLLNPTNDGWFWGSSILDLHFACNVFRAVELRRPLLVSANTGVTSWLDDCGREQQRSQRRTVDYLVGRVGQARVERSIYCQVGDIPWFFCLLATVGVLIGNLRRSRWGVESPAQPTNT